MGSRNKLEWLEMGRGCAALAVLICHGSETGFPGYLSFVAEWGDWGVCFFFVLSGFIIHHIHSADLGAPDRASNFAWRRFIRIFPTYWLILLAAIVANNFLGNSAYAVAINANFVLKNFLLLPDGVLFISPAWTLRHELLFYGLFLVAILNFRIGVALFVAWFLAIIVHIQFIGLDDGRFHPTSETLTGYRNLFFFAGIAISVAAKRNASSLALLIGSAAASIMTILAIWIQADLVYAATQLCVCAFAVCCGVKLSESGYNLPG